MTYDDVKRKLKEYRQCERLISAKTSELERLRHNLTVTGIDYAKPYVISSTDCDAVFAKMIDRCLDLENEITAEISDLKEIRQTATSLIDTISGDNASTLKALLVERYINGGSWRQIADSLHYSEQHVKRLHYVAICRICQDETK